MQPAIASHIRSFILSDFLLGREYALTDDASFLEAGIIDSIGILELVAFLEESYGITIPDDELIPENLDSVRRVASYVERKLALHPMPILPGQETAATASTMK